MRSGNRSNALLVELLIVILFFMLASTILLQVFSASRKQSDKAGLTSDALIQAQNLAECLYAGDAPEDTLSALGYELRGEEWLKTEEGYTVRVSCETHETASGNLSKQDVSVYLGDERLLLLPVTRYREAAQ